MSQTSLDDERLIHIKEVIQHYTSCWVLLDNLQCAHYLLLKAKQQAHRVPWMPRPMRHKLEESIREQAALLHMIADYLVQLTQELEFAQRELLIPVVYPDGISLASDADEELRGVRENCFRRFE